MARAAANSATLTRSDVLNALLMVQPALETRDFIEILTHLCFDGELVFACNDVIALRAPCRAPIVGAVRGDVMIKLLESSKANDVTLSTRGGNLIMKLVKADIELPMMGSDAVTMKWPTNLKSLPKVDISHVRPEVAKSKKKDAPPPAPSKSEQEELIEALDAVFPSIATDTGNNEFFGVSLQRFGDTTYLYTTDRRGASRWELSFPLLPDGIKAVVLRRDFCEQMVRLFKDKNLTGGKATLFFDAKQQRVYMEIGDIDLWGQAHFPEKPFDFEKRIFAAKIEAKDAAFAPMTAAFRQAIERARILLFDKWGSGSDVECDGGNNIEFHTVGHGQCSDTVSLDRKQAKCSLYIDPQIVQRGLDVEPDNDKMKVALNPDAIALAAGPYTYIAGTSARPKVESASAKDDDGSADDAGGDDAGADDEQEEAPRGRGRQRAEKEPEPQSRSRRR